MTECTRRLIITQVGLQFLQRPSPRRPRGTNFKGIIGDNPSESPQLPRTVLHYFTEGFKWGTQLFREACASEAAAVRFFQSGQAVNASSESGARKSFHACDISVNIYINIYITQLHNYIYIYKYIYLYKIYIYA